MKIYFFLLGGSNTTTTYANSLIANEMRKLGYEVEMVYDINRKWVILRNPDCQVIFFQKTVQCPAHTRKHISHLKGRVYLVHIDNDFFDMDREHIETLQISDLILVCTEENKRAFQQYTDTPIEVFTNLLDFDNYRYIPFNQRKNQPLIISWQQACADAYVEDLLMIAEPMLTLHQKYRIEWHIYGWHEGKDYPDNRRWLKEVVPFARLIPYQPLEQYWKNIVPQLAASDLFLAPYISHPARCGKSGFGLKRIMLLGIPVVASDTEHHRTLIDHGVNGFLASSPDEWYKSIETLILHPRMRDKFSRNSRKRMEAEFNNSKNMSRIMEILKKYIPIFE